MKTKTPTNKETNKQIPPKKAPVGCTIATLIAIIGLGIYIIYAIFFKSPELPDKTTYFLRFTYD